MMRNYGRQFKGARTYHSACVTTVAELMYL